MTTRSLIATAAAALVAGTLLSAGAFAAAPAAPTSGITNGITKVSSVKASKDVYQVAQGKKKKKGKSKGKKKRKRKGKKKM